MNREQFDKMIITEQLLHINSKLETGITLRKICDDIGIARSTLSERFKTKIGYKFDKPEKQFISDPEYKKNINILPTVKPAVSRPEYKKNTNVVESKVNQNKVLDILEKYDNITEMLNWYNNEKNAAAVDVSELRIDRDKLQGAIKVTTVRLYGDIWEGFRDFMDNNKEFKSMDMISMALLEYMNKYEK